MADKEISALTAATTPLAGTELVHIDQGGDSRKALLSDVVALSTGAMLKATYDPNDDGIIAVAQGGTNSATASGARTNLGLGTMAVQNAATVAITGGSVTGITDITVADGGTGSSTASGARTNLGLVIGTDVMAYSANLAGFAATTVANVQNRDNHTGTQLAATISDFSTAADLRVAAAVGVSVQAYDALLASVSGLSLTAGDIIYATGPDAVARLPIGGAGQVLAASGGVPAWGTELSVGGLLAANNLSDVASADTTLTNLGFGAAGKAIAADATITGARETLGRFDTVADALAATLVSTPDTIEVAAFNAVGDDGGALYVNPVALDPGKTDQIEVGGFYYNRLHRAGEVDFAKHGMFLDGRLETTLFQDAFAVALDRGLDRLVMPGGKSLLLTEARVPLGSFDVDLRGTTILADFNGALAGGTANAIRANNFDMSWVGTNIGNMTAGGGLTAAFDGDTVKTEAQSAGIAALSGYVGKTFPEARRIFRAVVYGSSDAGYVTGANPSVTLTLYGKTGTAPATETDGTSLGTLTFTDTADESTTWREVVSTDQTTEYTHVWVRVSTASGTAVRMASVQIWGESPYMFSMRNMVLDGQCDSVTALTAQKRVFDVEGYRRAVLRDSIITKCAKGGTTATPILYRDDRHTQFHNCGDVFIDRVLLEANRNSEGIIVQSTDQSTLYHMRGVRCIKHESSGTPISVFNCGPGKIERCYVDGTTGSGMNILSRYAEVAHNTIKNVSSSVGIDMKEGNIYSHGSWVHHNWIENTSSTGLVGCGNGLRIENNVFTGDCLHGIDVTSELGTLNLTHGAWLDGTLADISGVIIGGNRFLAGFNADNDGNNSNIRVLGEPTAQIEVEIHVTDEAYTAVKTENNIWLREVSHAKISGKMMQGRTALVKIDESCGTVELNGVTLAPEAGQTVTGVLLTAGTVDKLLFNDVKDAGTFDVGMFHINRSGGGTFTDIQINNSPTIDEISVPAGTPTYRDGAWTGTFTPTIVGTTTAGAGTYSTQTGTYTRRGNQVYVFINLTWTAHTGTGNMEVAGLPFNASGSGIPLALAMINVASTAPVAAQTSGTPGQVSLINSSGAGGAMGGITLDVAGTVRLAGTYTV